MPQSQSQKNKRKSDGGCNRAAGALYTSKRLRSGAAAANTSKSKEAAESSDDDVTVTSSKQVSKKPKLGGSTRTPGKKDA